MRTVIVTAIWIGVAISGGRSPLLGQQRDNTEKQMTCTNSGHDSGHVRHCEVREQTYPSIGRLSVDGGANGGATVKGWQRNEVLVRARIQASADTEGAAANLVSRVLVDGNGGQVKATGPDSGKDSWWSVSYEIFVPQATDVSMKTNNGAVAISDVRGQLHFETRNGAASLKRVAGDVTGETANGAIQVEIAGATWDGRQMDLKTRNGAISVTMPARFSANIQAETGLGSIQSDFPMPQTNARERSRKVEFAVGSGGPPIHIATGNGGIRLKRAEAQ